MKAILVLSDGTVFEGESIGQPGRALGEVVFSTSMVGYQQALTDPSCRGQILTLTYPLIGNYGTNDEDYESDRCQVAGLVVKEMCDAPSNFRCQESLGAFLTRHNVVGIAGVDTRALTRRLRDVGVMMGAISTDETVGQVLQRIAASPYYGDIDFVQMVSTRQPYEWRPRPASSGAEGNGDPGTEDRLKIVVLDYGIRESILRNLWSVGGRPVVLPCTATADDILAEKPDGVLFSPGPGDPRRLDYAIAAMQGVLGRRPVLGICLGNHLLGCAVGGSIFKLKFGHRGGNHPVKCLLSGRIRITSQNHGYAVDADSIGSSGPIVSMLNLNDNTVEGLEYPQERAYSIQFHAEAGPGPLDSRGIFKQFVQRIRHPQQWRECVADVC